MTIRPRHYAELLIADADTNLVASRLQQLAAIAAATRQLTSLVTNPATKPAVAKTLKALDIDPLVQSLVMELATVGRLNWLRAIVRAAESKLATQGAAVPAHVTLAHPVISEAQLRTQLTDLLGPVSSIDITIDPNELGGIRAQAADRSFDTRLDHRLHQLRRMVRERNA